jgi:hypothetical protein
MQIFTPNQCVLVQNLAMGYVRLLEIVFVPCAQDIRPLGPGNEVCRCQENEDREKSGAENSACVEHQGGSL